MKSIARSLAVEMALQQRAMGRRIAQMRERAHLTQEAAADKAGVTLRAYQKWEAGGGIQFANLQRLADALGVAVDQITGEAETPNPFRISEQMDGGFDEFREYVAQLNARLDQVVAELQTASDDRVRMQAELQRAADERATLKAEIAQQNAHIKTQNKNLLTQTTILEDLRTETAKTLDRIEGLVATLPTDEATQQLIRALREAS